MSVKLMLLFGKIPFNSKLLKNVFFNQLYIGETTEKEGQKIIKKSRTLRSVCFQSTLKKSKLKMAVRASTVTVECQSAHPRTG